MHFCVALDSPELRERLALRNPRPAYEWHAEPAWLRCSVSQIERVTRVEHPQADAQAHANDTIAGAAAAPAAGKRKAPEARAP